MFGPNGYQLRQAISCVRPSNREPVRNPVVIDCAAASPGTTNPDGHAAHKAAALDPTTRIAP
jgi:hypothetical protein